MARFYRAGAASSRAGHVAAGRKPDARKQIAADSIDAVEREHDISCIVIQVTAQEQR
jgi:hypothetical protein